MLRIITDSASDITLAEAEAMQISIVPLSITFPDGECPQETTEDFESFYRRLAASQELPTTSQTPPEGYLRIIQSAQQAGEEVLILSLSGGLSGTFQAACTAKALSGYEKVFAVDTHQAIIAQRMLVEQAVQLRDQGLSAGEIADRILSLRDRITVSGIVDTLTYLRKGGRIPSSLAILGSALNVKPIIALQGTKLQAIGKAMGRNAGKRLLYQRLEKYPPDPNFPIFFGYTSERKPTEAFMEEMVEKYSLQNYDIRLYPVGGVIGTHVGTGCIAICYCATEPIT